MDWIGDYQLFLFDFDGLLVDTEALHYEAYKLMVERKGFSFPFDFYAYCLLAHYTATGVKDELYRQVPGLYVQEPNWNVLYQEKKQIYHTLLAKKEIALMPGVSELLSILHARHIAHCVVTHSPKDQVFFIRDRIAALHQIPFWITREDYNNPKPHPDGYLTALNKYRKPEGKVIGFEDSPRGVEALLATKEIRPIMVNFQRYPATASLQARGVVWMDSFISLMDSKQLPLL